MKYCDEYVLCVCLCVCLSVHVHVVSGHGLVVSVIYFGLYFGFVHDIMFSLYGTLFVIAIEFGNA